MTTHPYLVPRLWKSRAIPLLPLWARVACYRVKPYLTDTCGMLVDNKWLISQLHYLIRWKKFCQNLPPNLPTTMSKLAVATDPASCLKDTWVFMMRIKWLDWVSCLLLVWRLLLFCQYTTAWHTFDMSSHYVFIAVCSFRLVSHFLCKLLKICLTHVLLWLYLVLIKVCVEGMTCPCYIWE